MSRNCERNELKNDCPYHEVEDDFNDMCMSIPCLWAIENILKGILTKEVSQ